MAIPQPIGEKIGEWTILRRCDDNPQKYVLQCSCGTIAEKYLSNLRRGYSLDCGGPAHKQRKAGRKLGSVEYDTTGMKFNHWTVLEEVGGGKIKVQCDCPNKTTGIRYKKAIISGESKSCGCASVPYKTDLIGKRFGNWVVIGSAGNGMCLCQCNCANHTLGVVSRANLINGKSQSCGCLQGKLMHNTMMERYGEIASRRLDNPCEQWQIDMIHNSNQFKQFIIDLTTAYGRKPTINDLCNLLDIQSATMLVRVHEYGFDDIVDILPMQSHYEDEIVGIIKSIDSNLVIIRNDRKVLQGMELDIYLPDKRIAIEFNGTYWHSTVNKDIKYHQNKTLLCFKSNIHLIHIFEYEWNDASKKQLIINYLQDIISSKKKVYHARNCEVKEIYRDIEASFENTYHLQGYAQSSVALGLYYNNELISVMSFGRPRFDDKYEYELIRYCVKSGCAISGGKEKLFKHFVDRYLNSSIITYCNISKFTGMSYFDLGFKRYDNWITVPGYVWVKPDINSIVSRYQAQKKNLVQKGLGTDDETEDIIMTRLGYLKIYDAGNLKLVYKPGDKE